MYVPKSFLDHSNLGHTNESSKHMAAEAFVNKWIDFRFGVFGFEASRSERRTDVFVNLSNETIDGVSSTSDQLLRSDQAILCDGKTYEEVIAQHPDVAKGE